MILWYLLLASYGRALELSNGEDVLLVLHLASFIFTWAHSLIQNVNNKSQRNWFKLILYVAVLKISHFYTAEILYKQQHFFFGVFS